MDRRVARTRAQLQHAFLSLLTEQGFEKPTVEDICRRAGVARSTFYAHFGDKRDLKRNGFGDLRAELVAASVVSAPEERLFSFSLPMLEHARANLPLYESLVHRGGADLALDLIREMLVELVRSELVRINLQTGLASVPRKQLAEAVVAAFLALMLGWLEESAARPSEEVDGAFRALIGPIASNANGTPPPAAAGCALA